jgi:predicted 3-demethylubiquinone-9 3-methyltransferase (glyoxalase superfamily)
MENNNQGKTAGNSQHELFANSGQKITPFLWFDGNVKEALDFYTSVFKNSRIVNMHQLDGPDGKITTATFQLEGVEFMILDGGTHFKFSEATSFFVKCKTQDEVDDLWDKLTKDGGEESMCGWLKDKFGVSWQIIPEDMGKLMGDPDPAKAKNVMNAMMKMRKLDLRVLQEAYDME